jgi:hypothetical protein
MSEQLAPRARRTPIKIAVQETTYAAGQGATVSFVNLQAKIGETTEGAPVYTEVFYAEWTNAFGQQAIQAASDNVLMPARVNMVFVQSVYDAMISKEVRIYRYGRTDAANTFVLAAAADNVRERGKWLEFNVKRYEGK